MTKLREHPTLPSDDKLGALDDGELWPKSFCAFVGCNWSAIDGSEDALHAHLMTDHSSDLAPIRACMLRCNAPDALMSIYREAIAVRCRNQAPLAGSSLDRTALKSFTQACSGNKVESLICFSCAGIFTFVEELALQGKGDISWVQPLRFYADTQELYFMGRPVGEMAALLGLDTFLDKYDTVGESGRRLTDHEDFADWSLRLPGSAADSGVCKILCCPEACSRQVAA